VCKSRKFLLKALWRFIQKFALTKISHYMIGSLEGDLPIHGDVTVWMIF